MYWCTYNEIEVQRIFDLFKYYIHSMRLFNGLSNKTHPPLGTVFSLHVAKVWWKLLHKFPWFLNLERSLFASDMTCYLWIKWEIRVCLLQKYGHMREICLDLLLDSKIAQSQIPEPTLHPLQTQMHQLVVYIHLSMT